MQKGPSYGILGGTFDPPHVGHLVLAQEAFVQSELDRVWFMPAADPPHKPGHVISAWEHRHAMVAQAIAGDARFALMDVEHERRGPSYTVDTLRVLRSMWGSEVRLTLILGWDMLAYLPHWYDPVGVVGGVDQIAAAHRPGFDSEDVELERLCAAVPGLEAKLIVLTGPRIELAATTLRERVASGLPVRYLVPDAVAGYIERHQLYVGTANATTPPAASAVHQPHGPEAQP